MKKVLFVLIIFLISVLSLGWTGWGEVVTWFKSGDDIYYEKGDVIIKNGHRLKIYNADNTSYTIFGWSGSDFVIFSSSGTILVKPNGDTNDYWQFATSGNVPTITSPGSDFSKWKTSLYPYTDDYYTLGGSGFRWKSIVLAEQDNHSPTATDEFWINGDTLFFYDGSEVKYWLKDGVK